METAPPYSTGAGLPVERPPSNALLWILLAMSGVGLLLCAGIVSGFVYLAVNTPDSAVYTGNRLPNKYRQIAREVGALDDDETVLYFYSDAFLDVRQAFYFVSDKKVAIYLNEAGESPLTAIAFDEIADLELSRDESFFDDSEITLYLNDERIVSFPVSSEHDRDRQFFDAIRKRAARPKSPE